ncbi:2648_t:CDS:1, partial [Gigaspora rosea]
AVCTSRIPYLDFLDTPHLLLYPSGGVLSFSFLWFPGFSASYPVLRNLSRWAPWYKSSKSLLEAAFNPVSGS